MAPLSVLALQARRATGTVVGRQLELSAIKQELGAAKAGRLTAVTLEGEPGIGKTRVLLAAAELAAAEGFTPIAVTADEEIRGPFLVGRSILAGAAAGDPREGTPVQEQLQRALDSISGRDDPSLDALSPDQKLLRTFDLAALAMRELAAADPVAIVVDDLQWADDDSLRMLRYVIRAGADVPIFLALATRPEELAVVSEATTLIADMERMGMVRRLKLERFTQVETTEFLKHILGGNVNTASAATIHAQAEGVAFIVEELARTYRETGLVQEIDGVWTLARNAERLVPSAVRTLIQRRAARLPADTREHLADAAILGRSFSLKDLRAVKLQLKDEEGGCDPAVLAEALAPAVRAGLLVEHGEGSPADYGFTHDQVREFASATLTPSRRRAIHLAIVDMLTGDGDPPPASLTLLARHAVAAGDADRAARFSVAAARAALEARAAEEVLRIVDQALPTASAAHDRVALLTAQDEALDMLRRPAERLEGLAEIAALAEALGDSHLELDVMLRRAAALRVSEEEDLAADLARGVRRIAAERGDRQAELAACLELGQDLLRSPLGESFTAPASDVELDGAGEAYARAAELAAELGEVPALAAATRELGVISVARARAWYVERVERGEDAEIRRRVGAGETPDEILPGLPIAPLIHEGVTCFERAIGLFEQIGDRRGLMSAIIARAYLNFAIDVHLLGAAKRIEEIRRLAMQMKSLTRESERESAEAQMLYGVQVFAHAKVVPDLALSRGREAHRHAKMLGDRSLEFASAACLAMTHLELDDVPEAERWVDRAADAAAAAPTPLRARRLELVRGYARAAAGDAAAMREHLERAVRLATEQGRPAARCEALAALALEAARVGSELADADLLALAERSAIDARDLVRVLPGHPPWGAAADAALAQVAVARGAPSAAAAARSALEALDAGHIEDLYLRIVLPAVRAIVAAGTAEEREAARRELRLTAALIAQRITDEEVRVLWFRGPLGRELSRLAGAPPDGGSREPADGDGREPRIGADDTALLWLLIEGRTNGEIARELGMNDDDVTRRLAEMYARIGVSSRGEAAVFAFREGVV
jgi:DNA-binding CsgD family transcriptional regulator